MPVDRVIATNRKITTGNHALLDRGKLEGALGRPMHTWGGEYLYPTLLGRAGALLDALVNAHAFEDGNKRTAWASVNVYIEALGVVLVSIPPLEVAEFVERLATDAVPVDRIADWLAMHSG